MRRWPWSPSQREGACETQAAHLLVSLRSATPSLRGGGARGSGGGGSAKVRGSGGGARGSVGWGLRESGQIDLRLV